MIIIVVFYYYYYHYYDNNCSFFGCSYTGTNSCLTLCSSYGCLNYFWAAIRNVLPEVKCKFLFWSLCEQNLSFSFVSVSFFIFMIWRFFVLSPCSRGKLAICVCCSERTPRFYSLSSFMVPICTILKVLILVYMQNIPVLQQKTC